MSGQLERMEAFKISETHSFHPQGGLPQEGSFGVSLKGWIEVLQSQKGGGKHLADRGSRK